MHLIYKPLFFLCALAFLASCSKYTLSVRQQKVDPSYLASAHVGTPDPRRKNPPVGQKLIVKWRVPVDLLDEKPYVALYLLYKDYSEGKVCFPIEDRSGYAVYSLLNPEFEEKRGILTYRAEVVTENGTIYNEWKHQLWVNLIK
jgi:hypothetical protein